MSTQSVTVLCPNGRRTKISVTASKLLREVLEEACLSQGYDPDSYELKHQNRLVDESLSFRLSGLPNNVTLEIVSSAEKSQVQEVEIALQLSTGNRQQKKFLNSIKLLDLLIEFSNEFDIDLIYPHETNAVPLLTYMNKQWKGPIELAQFTLKSIGIKSGKALLRYSVVVLSEGERVALDEKILMENEKRMKLEEVYVKQKAENDQRAQLEAQREKEVELRHQQFLEEKEREFQQMIAVQSHEHMETDQVQPSSTNDGIARSTHSHTQESDQAQSRLHRLQNMLNIVNTSLNTNAADFLPDQLISDDGRIHLNRNDIMEIPTNSNSEMDFSNFKFPEIPISTYGSIMEAEQKAKNLKTVQKADRNALIFKKFEPQIETENDDITPDFFDLTVDDAKVLQRSLREEVRTHSQRAFLPKAFVDQKNKELKEQAYSRTVVRFLFKDIVIQVQFYSKEPVSRLFDFIQECLLQKNIQFGLLLIPNQKIVYNENRSLLDEGIAPKSTVIIKFFEEIQDFSLIFDEAKFQECTQDDAIDAFKEWLKDNKEYRQYNPTVSEEPLAIKRSAAPASMDVEEPEVRRKPLESNPSMPKWLKKK